MLLLLLPPPAMLLLLLVLLHLMVVVWDPLLTLLFPTKGWNRLTVTATAADKSMRIPFLALLQVGQWRSRKKQRLRNHSQQQWFLLPPQW